MSSPADGLADGIADDLVGTQAPRHRITGPAEALRVLERAAPGLARHRRTESAVPDWALIGTALGTALPGDFRLLAEQHRHFRLGGFLAVALPAPGREHAWLRGVRQNLEIVHDWWEDGMTAGLPPHPAPGGLLPWAESLSGDLFLWTTAGAGPDDWPVTVASRSGAWWHYAGGAVQFLAELLDGSLEPWALPEVRPEVTWPAGA
ncbi:hypothetical protein GCM10010218_44410 [Streptomyces mashuensis]|uniref:SMI1/KNR4 family protein n=1 Tax=Streptomyces mashuensis TaxID=33904 RepID=A0A919B795_9ACTN|nr:SMI1/KNR4 family protein [Streptomyces mashuensis]GHF58094.1 hypothetical protein GCM10010218_44410 [Streptomyces mashuensis]